ncbi:MAG: FAD-dependent oxidoreductase [Silvibacterium sp.]|nr:FAD-dependent oxidoreductase [Silvibacterium sp.]
MRKQHPIIAERFPDLHPPFAKQAAVLEANRCLNCFDAPCTAACPTHIDVPKFIKKITSLNLSGSAQTILDANVLGASCSRVCPVDVLCEGACVMHRYNEQPIEIARLQRFAMDSFHAGGRKLRRKYLGSRAGKIACIGAGPASLACAAEMAQQGFAVTVFERRELPGGLNTYGVAEYKLTASASLREIELIEDLGVAFRFGVEIDPEGLRRIDREFDLVFIGVGLGQGHGLKIAGGDHSDVVDALDFIAAYKMARITNTSGKVAVIGAGNTAIDAANAAMRLGAEEVSIVYRGKRESMSAFDFEYEHAKLEGVRFLWQTLPIHVRADGGTLEVLHCTKVDDALRPISGSEFSLPCNLIITAIGQSPLLSLLESAKGVTLDKGRVAVERETGQTRNPRYFAGGDCVNGGREVVDAVADGKRAGTAMARQLEAAYARF